MRHPGRVCAQGLLNHLLFLQVHRDFLITLYFFYAKWVLVLNGEMSGSLGILFWQRLLYLRFDEEEM
jgi:hypothetical protein